MKRSGSLRDVGFYVLIAILLIVSIFVLRGGMNAGEQYTYGQVRRLLEEQREAGKDALPPSRRRRWFSRLLSAALEKGRPLTSKETESLLRQFCKEELP